MANHSLPTLTSTYTNFVTELDGRLYDLAVGLDPAITTVTNPPTNAIRWNSVDSEWEKWNGTIWVSLDSLYAINISGNADSAATLQTARTINGVSFNGSANITVTASTTQALTFSNAGSGAASGSTFNGSTARTISYNSIGAAPTASPAFTGTPTAPTATSGTSTTQIATTAFVSTEISTDRPYETTATNIKMNGTQAVGTANTVARGDHVHPTDTTRAPLASPAFTGIPTAPTAAAGTSTTQIATTAFVSSEIATDVGVANSSMVKTAINAAGSAPIYAARAWVNFNGTGTVSITASGNVSSITDDGVGDYTVNFVTALPDANYSAVFGGKPSSDIGVGAWIHGMVHPTVTQTSAALRIRTINSNTYADAVQMNVVIFR